MERHVLNLSKELIKRGHEVDVYTCNGMRNGEALEAFSLVDGIPVYRFRSVANIGEFGKVWPGFVVRLLSTGYDVIHAHAYRHPHTDLSLAVSKLSRCQSVLTAHSPFHPAYVRTALARALVPIYDGLLARFALRAFDRIVSLTNSEAEVLLSFGARRQQVVVIPHGVQQFHFSRVDPSAFIAKYGLQGKKIILYLGRINRTKGLNVLVQAFARIASIYPHTALVLVGPCSSVEEQAYR